MVKEATALDNAGYSVTVIYAPLSPWADAFDQELFKKTPRIQWIRTGYHSVQQPLRYKWVRFRRKANEWLSRIAPFFVRNPVKVYVLFSQELIKKALAVKADVYIGHNLGALPAVVKAAAKWGSIAGFDAEDFHRGEFQQNSASYKLASVIEGKYIPRINYLTAASPLIAEAYQKLFPGKPITAINNVFSRSFLQQYPAGNASGLSLFWISQTVGKSRGLETVIAAVNQLPHTDITLHILGNCPDEYKNELTSLSRQPGNIHFVQPVSPDDVFAVGAQFDVGLATELPNCENRDICLTNKLFTYLLSGNCVIASDTAAQRLFLQENPGIGLIYSYDNPAHLATQLERLYSDRNLLLGCRQQAHTVAATRLNWEKESEKLVAVIADLVN